MSGAQFPQSKRRVFFKVSALRAKEVYLVGTFNDWDATSRPLKLGKEGVWRTYMALTPGTYEYRFLVDGEWRNDPGAEMVENTYGTQNCVRVVP
tara:strand:+ start:201 stop:482 length:282 start_codon:yes stop_codon:yes gene_type:complete